MNLNNINLKDLKTIRDFLVKFSNMSLKQRNKVINNANKIIEKMECDPHDK